MDYLLASWAPGEASEHALAELRRKATAAGMCVKELSRFTWLATAGPRPPKVLRAGAWLLIGDVLDRRRSVMARPLVPDDDHSYERKMMGRFWGRYVGVRLDSKGRVDAVLRDPSGALECLVWSGDGLTCVASDAPAWLVEATRPPWTIDFDRVSSALRNPLASWGNLLIKGPEAVLPGCLQVLPVEEPALPLWSPDEFARQSENEPIPDGQAGPWLRDAVEESVSGLIRCGGALAAEISGGLDSGIVAGTLGRLKADVGLWLNAYGDDPESDERRYAHAVADGVGATLVEVPRSFEPLTEPMLAGLTHGIRPGFNALDAPNDLIWADRLGRAGATVLLTGKGGDAVFVQGAGTDVFADLWRKTGWAAALSPALPALARWNGRSVWSLIADARKAGRRAARLGQSVSFAPPQADDANDHLWLASARDLGPAKRYQIAGVINGVTFSGPSHQSAVAELVHPLLAQPVVEACLTLSARQLTMGLRDRALARDAFRDRLPALVAERRSKGDLTAYYGRRLAGSLAVVRPWLLEGRLAAERIIDREKLERLLTEDSLIWRGGVGEIMIAVTLESWVRAWEARLSR